MFLFFTRLFILNKSIALYENDNLMTIYLNNKVIKLKSELTFVWNYSK